MSKSIPQSPTKSEAGQKNEETPLLPLTNSAPAPASVPAHSTELAGYFYMALSCLGYSAMSFFVHVAETSYNFPTRSSVFIRGIFHALIPMLYITFYLPLPQTFTSLSGKQWKLLVMRGLAGALGILLFFTALKKLPVGDAVTMFFSGPVMVIILSHFFLNEPITPIDTIAAVTSFIGIVLIARPDFASSITMSASDRIIGVICGITAAFLSAVAYVTIRSLGARIHFMVSVCSLGLGTLLISILVGGALGPAGLMARKEGSLLVALSALFALAGQCCLTKGLQLCRAGPGVLIRNLDVPFAYILGILFLAESPTLLRLLGSTLVLFSAFMIGVRQMVRA